MGQLATRSEVKKQGEMTAAVNSLFPFSVQDSAYGRVAPRFRRAPFHLSSSNLETSLQTCSAVLDSWVILVSVKLIININPSRCWRGGLSPGCALLLWACVDCAPCDLLSQQTVPTRNCLSEAHLLLLRKARYIIHVLLKLCGVPLGSKKHVRKNSRHGELDGVDRDR